MKDDNKGDMKGEDHEPYYLTSDKLTVTEVSPCLLSCVYTTFKCKCKTDYFFSCFIMQRLKETKEHSMQL